jgi:hypothetical protein
MTSVTSIPDFLPRHDRIAAIATYDKIFCPGTAVTCCSVPQPIHTVRSLKQSSINSIVARQVYAHSCVSRAGSILTYPTILSSASLYPAGRLLPCNLSRHNRKWQPFSSHTRQCYTRPMRPMNTSADLVRHIRGVHEVQTECQFGAPFVLLANQTNNTPSMRRRWKRERFNEHYLV